MTVFDLPVGAKTALSGPDASLSFDALSRVKAQVQSDLVERFARPPKRILGCLEDSVGSIIAMLACPEICDYMPINPKLTDHEILNLAKNGQADSVILASDKFDHFAPQLQRIGLDVLRWEPCFNAALTSAEAETLKPRSILQPNAPGRLILHTSGTTGAPKRVPIRVSSMMHSAKQIATFHELQADDIALNTLPTFHIGAVVDVLLAPFEKKGSVFLTTDRTAAGLHKTICDIRPTWVQLVPTILLHLIETLPPDMLRDIGTSLRFVRNISAPVPPSLKTRAEELLGCPIIEMYGMTEAAGQIATNGRSAQDRRQGTVGRLFSTPVKLLDATGSEVSYGRSGEICISGPTVFEGYEGVPRSEVFFDTWFRTGDMGVFDDDGFLSINGRLKEMINIGGEKVAPLEIETAALTHPNVTEAAAYALTHPSLGEVSGLTVAVRHPIELSDLQTLLASELADFKLPRKILQVKELPRLPNAKVDRLRIAREAQNESVRTDEGSESQSPQDRKLAALWAQHLNSRMPNSEDDFFNMGGDSLSAITFLLELSKILGRDITPNQLFETPTFGALCLAVSNPNAGTAVTRPRAVKFVAEQMSGWPGQIVLKDGLFRGIGTVQNGTNLFWSCQSSDELDHVRESFGAKRPLYVVRSLFRMTGKSRFTRKKRSENDFHALASQLVNEIQLIQPQGPIALGGFCGGAQVMQHVARALQLAGRDIKLFISLDFWPTEPLRFPVVHGMSQSQRHSARATLRDIESPRNALHPMGCEIHHIETSHTWDIDKFRAQSKRICQHLDSTEACLTRPDLSSGTWGFEDRARGVKAKFQSVELPRFPIAGTRVPFKVRVQNTSDKIWDRYDLSGLCVEIALFNLDGCIRDAIAGFSKLDVDVAPGDSCVIEGTLRLPNKILPFICVGRMVSHGIAPSTPVAQNQFWKIILTKSN
ncbi:MULTISPECIES: AMP-binding protein [Pacificibacter]|uniref:AMP-binding protein n=1 Tax=Pacificibacter TaxID=1042323 RepID=UPI001C0A1701|nr:MULTISPECIES: AMP-binding protein [Pacificibacter]MBU2937764.1 AMP-binding protein [Pacificibacter marinus]MDO6616025.1 AMP-binding protein [Pacificibacter sp. 1_MG-2023]